MLLSGPILGAIRQEMTCVDHGRSFPVTVSCAAGGLGKISDRAWELYELLIPRRRAA
jgi:hypothetical protein